VLVDRSRVTFETHAREQVWAEQTVAARLEQATAPLIATFEWRSSHVMAGVALRSLSGLDVDELADLGVPAVAASKD
jgi:hypothetical protein